jgi:Na+-translocating ferredoxin:NAD+ oxidoreductase subunit B
MSDKVYQQLLEAMKKRGGPYSGADIPEFYAMVEVLFTPEEARINNAMPEGLFTAGDLSERMKENEGKIRGTLETMADKGLCFAYKLENVQYFQAAPFMPGILELQFIPGTSTDRDIKVAHLIDAYEKKWKEVVGIPEPIFPTSRVITVDRAIESGSTIHTYDQVNGFIEKFDPISVGTCYCRHAAALRGEDIHGLPTDVCMQFGAGAQYSIERLGAKPVTKEEAKAVLRRAEEFGLLHMSQNTADDIGFICNCDRWHCVAVTHALTLEKPGLMFNSGFEPKFDPDLCTACETCLDRCPSQALTMGADDVPEVNLDRCFGCAACATGCPTDAIFMVNKPGFAEPPKNVQALGEALKAAMS